MLIDAFVCLFAPYMNVCACETQPDAQAHTGTRNHVLSEVRIELLQVPRIVWNCSEG